MPAIKRLPDSELEVMLVIWHNRQPLHTGEIFQLLHPEKTRKIQGVQMLLSRLSEKGFIRCEKTGRLNYYTALIAEKDYRASETASFIDKLYGSSPSRLVAALVKEQRLSEEELSEIRRILDEGGD